MTEHRASSTLERVMPVYDFRLRHDRWIEVPPPRVYAALLRLRLEDLTIARPLLRVRHLGRSAGTGGAPLVERGPVTVLSSNPSRELVAGAVARPWQLTPTRRTVRSLAEFGAIDEPGWTKYLFDFTLTPEGAGTRLSTETRGRSSSPEARRAFAVYWILIRPFSGLVRRDMLRAVERLAATSTAPGPD